MIVMVTITLHCPMSRTLFTNIPTFSTLQTIKEMFLKTFQQQLTTILTILAIFLLGPNYQRLLTVTMLGPLPVLFGATAVNAPHAPILTTVYCTQPGNNNFILLSCYRNNLQFIIHGHRLIRVNRCPFKINFITIIMNTRQPFCFQPSDTSEGGAFMTPLPS